MTALSAPTPEDRSREDLLAPWRERPMTELIEHVLKRYHRRLERDLELLQELAEANRAGNPHWDVARAKGLRRILDALADELLEHMAKEENILFPWILGGNGRTAGAPIAVMQADHRRANEMLERLRAMTEGFRPPPGACTSWCRFVLKLGEVARDLEDHMTIEDHVLFPRALSGA